MRSPATPFPELLTNRLLLRKLEPADAVRIYELRTDPRVNEYIDRPPTESVEEGLRFIHRINISVIEGDCLYWAIVPKQEQDLIGTICLWNWNKATQLAEVGFELLPAWQGKGFMHEALHRIIGYAFEQLPLAQIEAWVHPQNIPCIRLLEANNFELIATPVHTAAGTVPVGLLMYQTGKISPETR
ncbi:MAG: GNAT family N-acetyltransferase [Chitinophagaceae bacterium]